MTEEQIQEFQKLLLSLDIKMYDSEDSSNSDRRPGKTIATINNIGSFKEYNKTLTNNKDEYLKWIKYNVWGFEFKEEALLYLKKKLLSFEGLQNTHYFTSAEYARLPEGTEEVTIYSDSACRNEIYKRVHPLNEVYVFLDILRQQDIYKKEIIATIKDLASDVKIHSVKSWNKKRKYDGSNPWITIGDSFKLTDPAANFNCAIDRHQAVLLFDYFEKAGVFFPYKKAKDISTLRYYLTGYSDDFLRKNMDVDSINSMKKDGLKNTRKKNESGVNLSGLHELLSSVLKMIEKDQELHKEKIKTNNQ